MTIDCLYWFYLFTRILIVDSKYSLADFNDIMLRPRSSSAARHHTTVPYGSVEYWLLSRLVDSCFVRETNRNCWHCRSRWLGSSESQSIYDSTSLRLENLADRRHLVNGCREWHNRLNIQQRKLCRWLVKYVWGCKVKNCSVQIPRFPHFPITYAYSQNSTELFAATIVPFVE